MQSLWDDSCCRGVRAASSQSGHASDLRGGMGTSSSFRRKPLRLAQPDRELLYLLYVLPITSSSSSSWLGIAPRACKILNKLLLLLLLPPPSSSSSSSSFVVRRFHPPKCLGSRGQICASTTGITSRCPNASIPPSPLYEDLLKELPTTCPQHRSGIPPSPLYQLVCPLAHKRATRPTALVETNESRGSSHL